MSVSGLPFDDIRSLLAGLPMQDETARDLARTRNDDLSSVFGSMGKQAELTQWLAGWSGKSPSVTRPLIALFAGTHKVASRLQPDEAGGEETLVSVTRLASGGAPVNQVCATHDLGLKVFDLALQYPVGDICVEEALDEKASAATIGFGMEAIAGGVDLLGLGAFGKGSDIASAVMLALLTGKPILEYMPESAKPEIEIAERAAAFHASAKGNPLEILRRIGGREHSALAGAILAARSSHIPVVLDGIGAVATAMVLMAEESNSCDHCVLATGNPCGLPIQGLDFVMNEQSRYCDGSDAGHAMAYLKACAAIHANSVTDLD